MKAPREYKGGVTPEQFAKALLRRVKPLREKKPVEPTESRDEAVKVRATG